MILTRRAEVNRSTAFLFRSMTKLWTCKSCRRRFANRNQTHSCGPFTVRDFLQGKTSEQIRLFKTFCDAVNRCGVVTTAPAKTRVGFQVRMIFAAVNRLNENGLAGHVVLARRLEHQRFIRIESISPRNHVHHFVLRDLSDVDSQVGRWLKEAYLVGKQDHLRGRRQEAGAVGSSRRQQTDGRRPKAQDLRAKT